MEGRCHKRRPQPSPIGPIYIPIDSSQSQDSEGCGKRTSAGGGECKAQVPDRSLKACRSGANKLIKGYSMLKEFKSRLWYKCVTKQRQRYELQWDLTFSQ
eukprot:60151-Pelagomonas_calceolata.AAC.1